MFFDILEVCHHLTRSSLSHESSQTWKVSMWGHHIIREYLNTLDGKNYLLLFLIHQVTAPMIWLSGVSSTFHLDSTDCYSSSDLLNDRAKLFYRHGQKIKVIIIYIKEYIPITAAKLN